MSTASDRFPPVIRKRSGHLEFAKVWRDRWLYAFMLPGILFFVIFRYLPIWGVVMAFKNYQPHIGLIASDWVGFDHIARFLSEPAFFRLLRNTLFIALLDVAVYFPFTILLALLLNEIKRAFPKRVMQTVLYLPHFLSWVVVVSIFYVLLTTEGGVVNDILVSLGRDKVPFLISESWFRPIIIIQRIWRDAGWGTILFLAALSGVDPNLYEAARIDGANRLQQTRHITIPAIRTVIVVLMILRLGQFLDLGFEQIFLMLNSLNRNVGDVFDTYVFIVGLQQGQFSYSAAVGLFKSVVGLILVMGADFAAKRAGEEGVF